MIEKFITLLFPSVCIGCGTRGSALCSTCITSIPPAEAPEDPRIHAVFAYTPLVGRIVHECKYNKKSAAFEALVSATVPTVSSILKSEMLKKVCTTNAKGSTRDGSRNDTLNNSARPICFVPIPLSRAHKQTRGFNQSEIAARTLAHALSRTTKQISPRSFQKITVTPLLRYTRVTNPQAKITTRAKRKENLYLSMEVSRRFSKEILYIIIDDVTTSGATCIEAMRALTHAGVQHVHAIALAHGSRSSRY